MPIQFNFNATNPAVILSQTGNFLAHPFSDEPINMILFVGAHVLNGSIEYAFDSLQELSSNNTIVQQISLQNGWLFAVHKLITNVHLLFHSHMVSGFPLQPQCFRCSKGSCKLHKLLAKRCSITIHVFGHTNSNDDYSWYVINISCRPSIALFTPSFSYIANNYTFAVDPQYLKFSIWLSFWNWTTAYVSSSHF